MAIKNGKFEADIDAGFLRVRLFVEGRPPVHISIEKNEATVSATEYDGIKSVLKVSGPNAESGVSTEFGLRAALFR